MSKEISLNYLRSQFDYMAFMILTKTIGYIQLNKKADFYLLDDIIKEFNIFYNIKCDKNNILEICKKLIDEQFYNIIEYLKSGCFDFELEITNDILKQVKNLMQQDTDYKNMGDTYSDYHDGKYYRLFLNLGTQLASLDNDRTDVGLGETLYHSFARFGSEGVDEYFDYFKVMCENNIVNYQNQNQQKGFCNCNPCTYWLLSSKKQLKYFNYLITTKDIKMNHICGNTHGPSAFGIITNVLCEKKYWDRIKNEFLPLDDEFTDMFCETLYNISKSNFSIGFDIENIEKLLKIDYHNCYIDNMFKYLISDEAIKKQYDDNKYPIYLGGSIDYLNNTDVLNSKYNSIVNLIKKSYYESKQKTKN